LISSSLLLFLSLTDGPRPVRLPLPRATSSLQ
jgi:hypothetical protein